MTARRARVLRRIILGPFLATTKRTSALTNPVWCRGAGDVVARERHCYATKRTTSSSFAIFETKRRPRAHSGGRNGRAGAVSDAWSGTEVAGVAQHVGGGEALEIRRGREAGEDEAELIA